MYDLKQFCCLKNLIVTRGDLEIRLQLPAGATLIMAGGIPESDTVQKIQGLNKTDVSKILSSKAT